jgi:hypothetical protein
MNSDNKLGIAGGFIYNIINGREVPAFVNPRNVGGPLQTYRRACLKEIGGFFPNAPHEDTVGLIMARMKGWSTRSYADLEVLHHKTATWHGPRRLKAKYKLGICDYIMGSTAIWEALRCLKEIPESPPFIGSLLRMVAYCLAPLHATKVLSPEVLRYVRREQYGTLRTEILGRLHAKH